MKTVQCVGWTSQLKSKMMPTSALAEVLSNSGGDTGNDVF